MRTFPATGGKWQISIGGETEPKCAADGKELFFLGMLSAVDISSESSSLRAGLPKSLFRVAMPPVLPRSTFEVTSDGKRFLVNVPAERFTTPIAVVLNWQSSLRR